MGDRVWLKLVIHGHIDTVAKFNEIVEALSEDRFVSDGQGAHDEFLRAILDGDEPEFEDHECNYADSGGIEDVLETAGVSYYIEHAAGGDFAAACKSWTPERGLYGAELDQQGEPIVSLSELRRAFDLGDVSMKDWVEAKIDALDKASGAGLPPFTVGDEVRAIFAEEIAKAALGAAA